MTDIIVRPQGPLAKGSDTRARIAFRPGGSAANQAAWLASFGVEVDFVARVGAPDVESETARLKAAGVKPHLVGDGELETGRLVALIDPDGERSFLTDRGANEALRSGDIPDALIAGAALIHLSGYSFFAPSPRAAVLDVMRRAGDKPVSVDPASAEFLREVGAENFLNWTRGAGDPVPQRRGSGNPRRLRRSRNPVRAARGALPSGRCQAWRGGLRSRGGRAALASRSADKSRRSTPPARATLSSPPSSPRALPTPTCRPGWSAPSPPARSLRQSSAGDRARLKRGRRAQAREAAVRTSRYFDEQKRDFVSGGWAVSSMAQNGIDQTKSAGKANRVRPPSLTTLGKEGGPPGIQYQPALIGPTGACPILNGSPIDVGSKPAKVVAWPSASKAARP